MELDRPAGGGDEASPELPIWQPKTAAGRRSHVTNSDVFLQVVARGNLLATCRLRRGSRLSLARPTWPVASANPAAEMPPLAVWAGSFPSVARADL